MKRFTLATLAIIFSAGSTLTFSSNVKAESRQEYCRHHQCNNYNRDRDYRNRNYRSRDNQRQSYRWYDSRNHRWHYGYR